MSGGEGEPAAARLDDEPPLPPVEVRAFVLRVAAVSFGNPPDRLFQVLMAINVAGGPAASFVLEPAEARALAQRLMESARYVELAVAPAAGAA